MTATTELKQLPADPDRISDVDGVRLYLVYDDAAGHTLVANEQRAIELGYAPSGIDAARYKQVFDDAKKLATNNLAARLRNDSDALWKQVKSCDRFIADQTAPLDQAIGYGLRAAYVDALDRCWAAKPF